MSDAQKNYDVNLQVAHRMHDRSDSIESQLNDGAFKAADMALRTVVAINGGAIVALLALIGSLAGRVLTSNAQVAMLVVSLSWFIYGLVASVVSMAGVFGAYFLATFGTAHRKKTYEHPYIEHTRKSKAYSITAFTVLLVSILVGFASLSLFAKGVLTVQASLLAVFN